MKLSECRLDYFDQIINDVDIKTEQAFSRCFLDEREIVMLDQRRELIVSQIKQVQAYNLAALDKSYNADEFETIPEAEIYSRLFRKFCFFVQAQIYIEYDCFADELFGHLVVVDRYLSEDILAAFNKLLSGNKKTRTSSNENLLFKLKEQIDHESQIQIDYDFFQNDKLMINTTVEELFKLKLLNLYNYFIESVKEPARILFEHVQSVEYSVYHLTPFQEVINSVRLIASNAEHVSIDLQRAHLKPDMFFPLSDIKIKSLRVGSKSKNFEQSIFNHLNYLQKLTISVEGDIIIHEDAFQNLTKLKSLRIFLTERESFKFDFLLPLVELEELTIFSYEAKSEIEIESNTPIKLDKLKKLKLVNIKVDIKLIESSFAILEELELKDTPTLFELIENEKPSFFQTLKKLDVKISMLNIDFKPFDDLKQLTSFTLQFNDILKLKENTFSGKDHLVHLDLSKNQMKEVDAGAMNGIGGLTTLDLSRNHLSILDNTLFQGLQFLTDLNLSFNKLTSVCGSIAHLSKLKRLRLCYNLVENVEDGIFDKLVELEFLDLSNNRIQSISPNTFRGLTKLETLNLSENLITSIAGSTLCGLSSLKFLDLSKNQISFIESTAFDSLIYSLQELVLDSNKISEIDHIHSLFQLTRLKKLSLKQNMINKLVCLSGMNQLTMLNLIYNQISHIDKDAFSAMKQNRLKELDLSGNKIGRIDSRTFSSLHQLKILGLSGNKLTMLDKDAFADLYCLELLNFQQNKIEHLDPKLFHSQSGLKRLDLSFNSLKAIYSDTFSSNLQSLEQLRLWRNKIEYVHDDAFAALPKLKDLQIDRI